MSLCGAQLTAATMRRKSAWRRRKSPHCTGCYYCAAHGGECVYKDDMAEILQKMIDADVLVPASPVYFYSIDARLKAVIDRAVARRLDVKTRNFTILPRRQTRTERLPTRRLPVSAAMPTVSRARKKRASSSAAFTRRARYVIRRQWRTRTIWVKTFKISEKGEPSCPVCLCRRKTT